MFTTRKIEFTEFRKRVYAYALISVITWIIMAYTILSGLLFRFPILVIFGIITYVASQMARSYIIDYVTFKRQIKNGIFKEEAYKNVLTLRFIKDKKDKVK